MATPKADAQTSPARIVGGYAQGYILTNLLTIASSLRLSVHRKQGTMHPVHELAKATQPHPPTLRRFLRAIAAFGLIVKLDEDRYTASALTPHIASPEYQFFLNKVFKAWDSAYEAIKTG